MSRHQHFQKRVAQINFVTLLKTIVNMDET
jgi:hypothetical protein